MKKSSILSEFNFKPINEEQISKFNDEYAALRTAKPVDKIEPEPEKSSSVSSSLSLRHEDVRAKALKQVNSDISATIHRELSFNTYEIAKATAKEVGKLSVLKDISRVAMSLKYEPHDRAAAIRSLVMTDIELPLEWLKASMHGRYSIVNNVFVPNMSGCALSNYERQKVKLIKKLASCDYIDLFQLVSSIFRGYMKSTDCWREDSIKISDLSEMFDAKPVKIELEKIIIEFNKIFWIKSQNKPFNFLVEHSYGCEEFNRMTLGSKRLWYSKIKKLKGYNFMSSAFKEMLASDTAETEEEKFKKKNAEKQRLAKRKRDKSKGSEAEPAPKKRGPGC